MPKVIRVEMPDDTVWDIPARIVAIDRAKYYAEKDTDTTYDDEYRYAMSKDGETDLIDWLENNMDWFDVESEASEVAQHRTNNEIDRIRNEGLANGEKKVLDL